MTVQTAVRVGFELSVVRSLAVGATGTVLTLRPPSLRETVLDLPALPDPAAAAGVVERRGRALAVRIDKSDTDLAGSVLCTTGHGPERVTLSLGAALALCRQGVHTVVTRRDVLA